MRLNNNAWLPVWWDSTNKKFSLKEVLKHLHEDINNHTHSSLCSSSISFKKFCSSSNSSSVQSSTSSNCSSLCWSSAFRAPSGGGACFTDPRFCEHGSDKLSSPVCLSAVYIAEMKYLRTSDTETWQYFEEGNFCCLKNDIPLHSYWSGSLWRTGKQGTKRKRWSFGTIQQ